MQLNHLSRLFRFNSPRLVAVLAALFFSVSALAQGIYAIPANARSGRLTPLQLPVVNIDGKDYRLAPGARIYNANHLTVTPNQVPKDAAVKYLLNSDGQIQTVWLQSEAPR